MKRNSPLGKKSITGVSGADSYFAPQIAAAAATESAKWRMVGSEMFTKLIWMIEVLGTGLSKSVVQSVSECESKFQ